MTTLRNPTRMRRLISAPLLAGAVLFAAGCADDSDPADGNGEADTAPAQTSPGEEIAFSEVEDNDSADSCWAVIDQNVYDLTDWVDDHPGGGDRIENICGTDATGDFTQQHGGESGPEGQLDQFEIGVLVDE